MAQNTAAKQLAAYAMDQLAGLENTRSLPMMGGYVFYYREKIFGIITDKGFLIKITPASTAALPDAVPEPPYEGAKPMLPAALLLEDRSALQATVQAMWPDLPAPKPRSRKAK